MQLRFIESDTLLQIRPEVYSPDHDEVFDVLFYGMSTHNSFWVQSEELYNNFLALGEKARVGVAFLVDDQPYRLAGELINTRLEGKYHLTLIEQITPLELISKRSQYRDEMRLNVRVYGLAPEDLDSTLPLVAPKKPEFSCEVFDISAGGVCLVSDNVFNSPFEPYFLLEFTISGKERFLLPAKLVRKGHCPQTSLFKHDYGFDFIFDKFPEEKHRLGDAIFSAKLEKL